MPIWSLTASYRLLCIREDHSGEGEAVNTLIAISLSEPDEGQVWFPAMIFTRLQELAPMANIDLANLESPQYAVGWDRALDGRYCPGWLTKWQ